MGAPIGSLRILFARHLPPEPMGMDGGSVTSLWIIDYLIASGHQVEILYLETSDLRPRREEVAQMLKQRGVAAVHALPKIQAKITSSAAGNILLRIWRALGNRLTDRISAIRMRKAIADLNDQVKPDLFFVFAEILEFCTTVKGVPKIGWLFHTGEPYRRIQIDLGWFKVLGSNRLARLIYPLWLYLHQRRLASWVATLDTGLSLSHWYGNRFRQISKKLPRLFMIRPHPAADEAGDITVADKNAPPQEGPPYRVVLVGNLLQSLTSAGLAYLANEILPELERRGILDKFEFLAVGKFQPRPELAVLLDRYPNVVYPGYVENLANLVNRAHVMLHPVPYEPGAGVRLSSMFGMHACCLVHGAVGNNFPELVHGENCLIANSGAEFVDMLLRLCEDEDLARSIRIKARETYETHYSWDTFGPFLDDALAKTIMGEL